MRISAIVFCVSTLAGLAGTGLRAQVFELSGGTSSVAQSDGGRLTVRGDRYAGTFGLGTVDGQLMGGAALTRKLQGAQVSVGSATIPFNLPTDVFDSNHFLSGLGATLQTQVQTRAGAADVEVFGGETVSAVDSPFFDASWVNHPSAALRMREPLGGGWTLSAEALVAQQVTALESLEWTQPNDRKDPRRSLKLALSAGVGDGHGYAAASVVARRPSFDVKGAYIVANPQFRRTDLPLDLTIEPDRENVSVVLRPTRQLTVTLGRQNYLTPPPDGQQGAVSLRSTVNQVAVDARLGAVSVTAMGFQSHYDGSGDLALSIAATRDFGPHLHLESTYLASRPESSERGDAVPATQALVVEVQRDLTPRWSVSTALNSSNGQESVSFGGSFLSNLVTFSADYQTFYVPANIANPFEQVLLLSADLHLWGGVTLHGGSFVAPNGKVMYTTGADATASRNHASAAPAERNPMGNMVLDGRVVDRAGRPVGGAALRIDQRPVYTNSKGYFLIREKKPHLHQLEVLGDQFLDGYVYRVVSAPAQSKSAQQPDPQPGGTQPTVTIVVERGTQPLVERVPAPRPHGAS